MTNNTVQKQQDIQQQESQDPSNLQTLGMTSDRQINNEEMHNKQIHSAEQVNQSKTPLLSQDLLNQLIVGVREGLKPELNKLKAEIKDDVKHQIEELDTKQANELDNLRVSINLAKKPYNAVVRGPPKIQQMDKVHSLQQKDKFDQILKNVQGEQQKQNSQKNAAIDENKGSSFGIPLVGSSSLTKNVENENAPIQADALISEEIRTFSKRSLWEITKQEADAREMMKKHVVIKFDQLKSQKQAVMTLFTIGEFLRDKKVLPSKEPYVEEKGKELSRKYILEFDSIEDVKAFRVANRARRIAHGKQGFSLDFHLTQQQKEMRIEIWAQFQKYMEAKGLTMGTNNIQLVYTVTTPWILMGKNQPRISCEEFRLQTAHLGQPGDHGFIVQTFQPKKLRRTTSDTTVNTLGDQPTPKFIEYLKSLYNEPPKKRSRDSQQSGLQDAQDMQNNQGNQGENVQSVLNDVNINSSSHVTIPTEQQMQNLRTIDPILIQSQNQDLHQNSLNAQNQNHGEQETELRDELMKDKPREQALNASDDSELDDYENRVKGLNQGVTKQQRQKAKSSKKSLKQQQQQQQHQQ